MTDKRSMFLLCLRSLTMRSYICSKILYEITTRPNFLDGPSGIRDGWVNVNERFEAEWPTAPAEPPSGKQRLIDKHSTTLSGLIEAMTSKVNWPAKLTLHFTSLWTSRVQQGMNLGSRPTSPKSLL